MAGHLKDGVDRLLLGRIDEGAGVDHENFGLFGSGSEARACAVEQSHHDLGVDEVFRAAEGDEAHDRGRRFTQFGHSLIVPVQRKEQESWPRE